MPINDKYQVVFVHIPKNGGTTVEYLLGMHGNIDTIGIIPYVNQVRNEFFFGAGSQEFTAMELKKEIGEDKFSQYKSFCIVRNPYSRLVSFIAWAKQYRPHATARILSRRDFDSTLDEMFRTFKETGYRDLYLKPQKSYICDEQGNILIDRIFRFEKFDEILDFIGNIIGKDINEKERRMPSNHFDYTYYLSESSLAMINEMYADDFELFGYSKI